MDRRFPEGNIECVVKDVSVFGGQERHWQNMIAKYVSKRHWEKVLAKGVGKRCWQKVLAKGVGKRCWQKVLAKGKGIGKIC